MYWDLRWPTRIRHLNFDDFIDYIEVVAEGERLDREGEILDIKLETIRGVSDELDVVE